MSIRHWPETERPREKLLLKGADALSDAELLAIFLRIGLPGCSAVEMANQLLQRFGGLRPLLNADQKTFCQARGLGVAKFAQLQAVMEMAHRHLAESLHRERPLENPDVTRRYLLTLLRDRRREIFLVLFLDAQHRVICCDTLFEGTLDGASIYPREVVAACLTRNAAAVIFAHNHPSGIAEPSHADQTITRRLKEALKLVDIPLLDHLVVGDGEVVSFAERGLL